MVIKSFNVSPATYDRYSKLCREHGISMSKQIEIFMEAQIEDDPVLKREYLEKLERVRKGKFIRVDDFAKRYGL